MCVDIPGQTPRKKIASCACGAYFPDCDLEDAMRHISTDSSTAHQWVWIDPDVKFLIPARYLMPRRYIHQGYSLVHTTTEKGE
jgi:hypothetical protein